MMMIIIKYYIKLMLSCSRHRKYGYALYQCTTLGLHNTYFSLLFTYSLRRSHIHTHTLHFRLVFPTHTMMMCRGAYENKKKKHFHIFLTKGRKSSQLCNITTMFNYIATTTRCLCSAMKIEGKTTDDVLLVMRIKHHLKTCVLRHDFKVFSACTRLFSPREHFTIQKSAR